jgi:hypothetical protein|tara:strand:- start:1341 stop:1493 length:153 start_codon:yes stop_codon:yes gene_type:complete
MSRYSIDLFNSLTDEDFISIHNAGQLKAFCRALTVDLHTQTNTGSNEFIA